MSARKKDQPRTLADLLRDEVRVNEAREQALLDFARTLPTRVRYTNADLLCAMGRASRVTEESRTALADFESGKIAGAFPPPPFAPSNTSDPIRARSADAALFELLAQVGGKMPAGGTQ